MKIQCQKIKCTGGLANKRWWMAALAKSYTVAVRPRSSLANPQGHLDTRRMENSL